MEILYNSNKNLVAAESSLNGGNWKLLTIKSGNWNVGNNNVVYTISGLNPNTTYTIQTRIANVNGLWTYSNKLTFTTKDIARISNVNNFEHGNTVTALITNPAGISGLNLVMKIGGTQILSRTAKIGSNTISCTDAELDNLYKKYGAGSSLTATFILSGNGYSNSKTCTVTLKRQSKGCKN